MKRQDTPLPVTAIWLFICRPRVSVVFFPRASAPIPSHSFSSFLGCSQPIRQAPAFPSPWPSRALARLPILPTHHHAVSHSAHLTAALAFSLPLHSPPQCFLQCHCPTCHHAPSLSFSDPSVKVASFVLPWGARSFSLSISTPGFAICCHQVRNHL